MVVGPRLIRPSDIFSVWVTILNRDWSSIHVAVSLFNDNDEIASNEESLLPNIPTAVTLRVPPNAVNGSYKIYVRGILPDGDVLFYNQTPVLFRSKSISIFIQLDKPMYRHEQISKQFNFHLILISSSIFLVNFRCIPVYSDLRGYFSMMHAYIIVNATLIMITHCI